ncbi:hypothetical protein TYRP_020648 [Tyrophagus putrescentiae]|nr:hypothetical protein TYRP_020648 [Tyrophagus putrescentiae]
MTSSSSPCPSLLLLNGLQQLEAVEADDAAGGRLRPLCDPDRSPPGSSAVAAFACPSCSVCLAAA